MYRSLVSLGNPVGDGQSKTYTALGAASGLVNTIETVKEMGKMLLRDTYTSVLNPQLNLVLIYPPA